VLIDEFMDVFVAQYESFLTDDDEHEYDVIEFNDLCFVADCLIVFTSESAFESDSPPNSLELKPLLGSLKYSFLDLMNLYLLLLLMTYTATKLKN